MMLRAPDSRTLWRFALKHECDPRSIVKALRGEPVKGPAGSRATAAAAELKAEGLVPAPSEPPPHAA